MKVLRIHHFLLIFLVAFLSRLFVLIILNNYSSNIPFVKSFKLENHIIDDYDKIAINLLKGTGFSLNGENPTCCRAPVYPIVVSLMMLIPGHKHVSYDMLRLWHIIIDAITALLVFWAVSKWFGEKSKVISIYAGLVYAINPAMILYSIQMGSETMANFFFVLYIGLIPMIFKLNTLSLKRILSLGLVGGLLILNKSIYMVLIILIVPLLWIIYRNRKYIIKFVLSFVISLLVVCPWSIRNYIVSRQFIIVQTLVGYNFWYDFSLDRNRNASIASGDLNRTFSGDDVILPTGVKYKPYSLNAKSDAIYDAALIKEAAKWTALNPLKSVLKVVDNIFSFWYFAESPFKMLLGGAISLILILLSIRGMHNLSLISLKQQALFLAWLILLINIIYSPILAVFRYSLTTHPLLCILISGNFISNEKWLKKNV